MNGSTVDHWAPAVSAAGSRRLLLGLVAVMPLTGVLAHLGDATTEAKRKRHGRRRSHRPGKRKDNRKGKRKNTGGGLGASNCMVCPSGCDFSSVQDAIDNANAGDTISICPGTYEERLIIDKNITLAGNGDGVVLDGNQRGPVVTANAPTATVVIQGVTIRNGAGTDIGGFQSAGGGIVTDCALTLMTTVVENNTAGVGGGIINGSQGKLTLAGVTMQQNAATDSTHPGVPAGGGAIYNLGELTVESQSVLSGNQAENGGAIVALGAVTISGRSRVAQNQARQDGGGIYCGNGATVIIDDSTVAENTAARNGGGIANRPQGEDVTLGIRNNAEIGGNRAQFGGGISNQASLDGGSVEVTVSDSGITSNTASQFGGGIFNEGGEVVLISATVFENTASMASSSGGGIFNTGGGVVSLDNQSAVGDNDPDNCVGTNACGA